MDIQYLLTGMFIGFLASVPLGPIGVLIIQKTINKGKISGFIGGAGAALSDTFYAIIAGFGLTFIKDFLIEQQLYLRIAAGIILLYLGFIIFYSNPAKQLRKHATKKSRGLLGDFVSIFLLTISNPLAVFFFGTAFAGFGIVQEGSSFFEILILTIGVFIGACFWWVILTAIVNLFRRRIRLRSLWWINKIAGILVLVFGLLALISIFFISEKYVEGAVF